MYQIIFYTALFIGVVPLLVAFVLKKKEIYLKHPVFPLVVLTALATLYEFVGSKILEINTVYWFQLYPLIEFITLYYFFSRILPEYRKFLRIFLPLAIIFYSASFFYLDEENKFVSLAINRNFIAFFALVFSSIWLKDLFNKLKNLNPFEKIEIPNIWQSDIFYFVTGIAVYHTATFSLFLLSSFIFNSSNLYFYNYWLVNLLATLFFRIFLIIGVWKMKQD